MRVMESSRRGFLKHVAAFPTLGTAAMLAGCAANSPAPAGPGRLKVAFSNCGLQTTWCKLGHDAAMLWANLLNLDVTWYDGELDPQKQRDKIDLLTGQDWDFCCFQSVQTGVLVEPVKQLKRRGIPVISLDTLLTEPGQLREVGVWAQIAADHRKIAQSSTRYLMEKIGGRGRVIHIGGSSAHSGARQRDQGFRDVAGQYPQVEVVGGGVRWCDWKVEKARDTFETLLQQTREPIAGAFFHNDDMALACYPALAGTRHEKLVITAVDGQKDGLCGVRDGRLAATTVNPTSMIHMMGLVVGQFIARNHEPIDQVPLNIPLPCPLVAKDADNLDAMFYLSDPRHCLI
jgi:ribose transport system substrate-binding protein